MILTCSAHSTVQWRLFTILYLQCLSMEIKDAVTIWSACNTVRWRLKWYCTCIPVPYDGDRSRYCTCSAVPYETVHNMLIHDCCNTEISIVTETQSTCLVDRLDTEMLLPWYRDTNQYGDIWFLQYGDINRYGDVICLTGFAFQHYCCCRCWLRCRALQSCCAMGRCNQALHLKNKEAWVNWMWIICWPYSIVP